MAISGQLTKEMLALAIKNLQARPGASGGQGARTRRTKEEEEEEDEIGDNYYIMHSSTKSPNFTSFFTGEAKTDLTQDIRL